MSEGPRRWMTELGGLALEQLGQHNEETTADAEELQYDPELGDETKESREAYPSDNSIDSDAPKENSHDDDNDIYRGSEREKKSIWNKTNSRVKDPSAYISATPDSDIEASTPEQQNTLEPADTWEHLRHITISRDQTEAGVSDREKLAVLQQGLCDSSRPVNRKPLTDRKRLGLPPVSGERLRTQPVGMVQPARGPDAKLRGSNGTDDYKYPSTIVAMNTNNELGKDERGSNAVRIAQLEEEIQELRRLQSSLKSTTWHVFHNIEGDESSYLTEPSWTWDRGLQVKLKGNSPLADPDGYLRQRLDVAFVVYKHYEHDYQAKALRKAKAEGSVLPDPVPVRETIKLLSDQMISALDAFIDTRPTFKDHFPGWQSKKPIESPFLFWYCYRSAGCVETMPEPHRSQMRLLTEWIDQNYNDIYTEAEEKFSRGRVSGSTMPFLVRPGEVLLSRTDQGIRGYIASSWADADSPCQPSQSFPQDKLHKITATWFVKAWSYEYDGRFYRDYSSLSVKLEVDEDAEDVEIAKLPVFPLRFETGEFRAKLEHRGRTMWGCRHKKLIAYKDEAANDLSGEVERYMIDFETYKKLHPDTNAYMFLSKPRHEMDSTTMESDHPPQHPELLVFPNKLVGYNLREKRWRDLRVDFVQEVSWNKRAFEHLVINHDTKDLVQALVTSKLESQESTDIIQGKGNGLIILLHGGPGTGKTFTAESVAEIAEKPLYRVTCGDIGTKPEQVEKYLESVLHLGKIWGCVVLLDEADVFLEQRTLTDLERNALVSVFLRVLEYYEGILILTSNRVGTFDEAFKSRIQLSLHYEALDKSQRRTIWSNFLNRLKTHETNSTKVEPIGQRKRKFEETKGIDFEDIERHVSDLAEHEMNGRQIRNAITTARQLAKFKGDSMTYKHLTHVITTSMKFDKYLEGVRDNYTDDQMARGEGIR